jgi:hypothetical protein
MKKLIVVLALAALCVCVPAGAFAVKAGKKPPAQTQVLVAKNAAWACKTLQTTMGARAFVAAYGANAQAQGRGAMRNAFGRCVSQKVRALRAAALFEPAAGTLTITAPTPPSKLEKLAFSGTISGGRPIAGGSITGTGCGGYFLRRRDGVGDREQLGVVPEQFEHLAVECRLAVRRLQAGFLGVRDRVAPPPAHAGNASSRPLR